MKENVLEIWVFMNTGARHPGGCFTSTSGAESWISEHALTGVLTKYPVDVGTLQWAIDKGFFKAQKPLHAAPGFIGGFTSASTEHFHYEHGKRTA